MTSPADFVPPAAGLEEEAATLLLLLSRPVTLTRGGVDATGRGGVEVGGTVAGLWRAGTTIQLQSTRLPSSSSTYHVIR